MHEERNNYAYEQMKELIKQFNYKNDLGINVEIQEFFYKRNNVKTYGFTFDNSDHYHIKVELDNFNALSVREIFHSFVKFIEYSGFTAYSINVTTDHIFYIFISLMTSGSGFCFELDFS